MSKIRTSVLMSAILLCLTAVASLLFVFGFDAPSTSAVAEIDEPAVRAVASHDHEQYWTKLTAEMVNTGVIENTKSTEAKYYLTGNLSNVKIKIKGIVTLCLNSKYLTGTGNDSVITVTAGATFTLCDCQHAVNTGRVKGGSAELGGGVHINGGGKFIMKGGAIRENNAVRGAGVYVSSNSEFVMSNGRIRKNTVTNGVVGTASANGNGAGVYIATGGKFTMTYGEIFQNTAEFSGGGVYIANNGNAESGLFEMSDGIISNNIAQNGGGVSLNKGKFNMTGGIIGGAELGQNPIDTSAETNKALIGGNTATVRGGGIFNAGGTVTISSNAKINFNNAPVENELGGGGGIHVIQTGEGVPGKVTVSGGTIEGNESWRGGGVHVGEGGTLEMTGGSVIGNVSATNGGGVHLGRGSAFTLNGGEISNNSTNVGAGVYVYADASFTMKKGVISYNAAVGSGGGVASLGNVTMIGGEISNNSANVGGGGVLVQNSAFVMENGAICGNSAETGGGVYVWDKGSSFAISGAGKINGNTATGNGGGVYCNGCVFTMTGGTIGGFSADDKNEAAYGGGVYIVNTTATISGGAIGSNTAASGGGLYVQNRNDNDNDGAADYIVTISGGTISGNTAATNGGGVFIDGTFKLSGGNISGNNFSTDGSKNSNVYLSGTTTIAINGKLKDGTNGTIKTNIGITVPFGNDAYVFTSGYGEFNKNGDDIIAPTEYFFGDNGECLRLTDVGEASVGHSLTHNVKVEKCTEEGNIEHWHCEYCDKNFSDATYAVELDSIALAAAGHNMNAVAYKAPSCTDTGTEAHAYCDRCEKHFTNVTNAVEKPEFDFVIAALEHDYQEVASESTSATCTQDGEKVSRCSRCNVEKKEPIPAHHTATKHGGAESTCTTLGNIEYWYCSVCEKYFEDEACNRETNDVTIPKLPHTESESPTKWEWADDYSRARAEFSCKACGTTTRTENATVTHVTQNASCTEAGKTIYTATLDGGNETTEEVAIDSIGHDYKAYWSAWSKTFGEWTIEVEISCSRASCGEVGTAKTTIKGVVISTTPATCIRFGEEIYSASVVYDQITYNAPDNPVELAKVDHIYGALIEDLAATCTEPGQKSKHCSVCGAQSEITAIPALGHAWTGTVNDGGMTKQPYAAFDAVCLDGLAVTFVCGNDASHTHTFTGATDTATVVYASGNRLHYGDTSVDVEIDLPDSNVSDPYICTINGIGVNRCAATSVVWEYSSDNATWATLTNNASFAYDGKSYSVRVRFAKNSDDDNESVGEYVNVFADKFKDFTSNGYSYTLAALGDYSIADSSRSVTVTKRSVAAGGAIWESDGAELMSGYVKPDGGGYKYYLSSTDGATAVTNAVVRETGDAVTVIYPYAGTLYAVEHTNNRKSASGMYTATATLTLVDNNNYEFALENGAADAGANLNADGTITVTKVWYVATCDNGFVGNIVGWAFGGTASPLPALEKDNAADPAEITLVLKRGTEQTTIGSAFNKATYSNYINSAMPEGYYTLEATVGSVTIDDVEFEGFKYTFTFTVRKAEIDIDDLSDLPETSYDGNLHIYQTVTPNTAIISAGEGVWVNYPDLYSSAVAITFSHENWNAYFTEAEIDAMASNKLFVNAGSYVAMYKLAARNYTEVTGTFNVIIAKSTYDLKDVVFDGDEVTYNGSSRSLGEITGIPVGVTATYEGNGQTNAGSHTVTATLAFADKDNYKFINSEDRNDTHIKSDIKAVYTATLKILQDTYNIDVTFDGGDPITYDGNPHSIAISGTLPVGVTVAYRYENNDQTNAGSRTVTAVFTGDPVNYKPIPDMTATLVINPIVIGLDLAFNNAIFVYNGEERKIELSVVGGTLPTQVYVSYSNNVGRIAGTYNATATVSIKDVYSGNYVFADGTQTTYEATLTITADDLNMGDVHFDGKTVKYTGNAYSLSITGSLPAGVTYSYENNDCVEVGTYTVIVHFHHNFPNYGPIEDMTATLKIEKATYDINVSFPGATVVYTGNAHSLSLRGVLPAGVTYVYIDNSRTAVGSQTVRVRFTGDSRNYEPIPDMTATLSVVPASTGITNVSLEGKTLTYDGNTHNLAVNGDLPDGVTVRYYYIDEDGNEVEFTGAIDAGIYDVIARFVLSDSENYREVRPLTARLTILAVQEPVRPPVVVEPSVAEIDTPILDDLDRDRYANAVAGEIVQNDDFPYWIVAVCVIAAEVVAMAVMGGYIAFRSHKKKRH